MIAPRKFAIGRTVGHGMESADVGNWLFETGIALANNFSRQLQIAQAFAVSNGMHRIHCARNHIVKTMLDRGFGDGDFLMFLDADAQPDSRLPNPLLPPETPQPGTAPWAQSFLASSLDFLLRGNAGVVVAPAVSGPPEEKLNVFIEADGSFKRMTRDEYIATPPQFLPVVGGGTHLMLIDCGVFHRLPHPWFEDQHGPDDPKTGKRDPQFDVLKSQDAVFCLKLRQLGIPIYCNLYAPAGHIKPYVFTPPLHEVKQNE
jgi:hypothetical protein